MNIEKAIGKLKRQILRNEGFLSKLEHIDLSIHGQWSKGYYEGRISGMYLAIDLLEEKE